MQKKLVKSPNRMMTGVLGGIADYFGWDATLVRLIYVAISVFTGFLPGLLVYLIAIVVMPAS